jgi:hypothetical protein
MSRHHNEQGDNMNSLERFLNGRIAVEEAIHYKAIAQGAAGEARANAERWIEECSTKRWILNFYRDAGHSAEPTAPAAWATLTPVLLRMAAQWSEHPDYNPAWATDLDVPETFTQRQARKKREAAA